MKARCLSFSLLFPLITSLFLFFSQPHAENIIINKAPSSWANAKDAFDRLVREPSPSTARGFYVSAFDSPGINNDKTEILDHIFGRFLGVSDGRYKIIAIEMLHGEVYAARSAIRLLDYVRMGWQKPRAQTARIFIRVGETLGELIRVNPALFLRACHEESADPYLKKIGWPVGFIPEIMAKTKTRASYELEMRREALLAVKDPQLRIIRDKCIETIDRQLENLRADSSDFLKKKGGRLVDPSEKIKRIFVEISRRPSRENMKKIVALFSDVPRDNLSDVVRAMFPNPSLSENPFDLISYEAKCCNEYAIEVLFNIMGIVGGVDSMLTCRRISNLILMKPDLFVEKLAKYRRSLVSEGSNLSLARVIPLKYLECICAFTSPLDYPEECESVILRRRIDALAALDMPEHKELIDSCKRVMESKLK